MTKVWDIVIVGGGLGGLSLAAELASTEFAGLSVLVLEKRSTYLRDRTWSYWTSAPHRYSHLERRQWKRWSVSLGCETHIHSSHHRSYASLDADAFYREAVAAVSKSQHVVLQMNSAVTAIECSNQGPTIVHLEHGGHVSARRVLDARPEPALSPDSLVQQFVGWEVQFQRDVFDTGQVTLMAFEPELHGLHFFYVLPYDARCALVESTWVSPTSHEPDYDVQLKNYIEILCAGAPYAVTYREGGRLGLKTVRTTVQTPVALGRRGGTLRPSTGFAFIDTITHAAQIARSLSSALAAGTQEQWQPVAFDRAASDQLMDAVFLEVLVRNWQRAPEYFMHLFKAVDGDDVLDFLTGQATWSQRLRIMRSLPAAPFLRVALSRFCSTTR